MHKRFLPLFQQELSQQEILALNPLILAAIGDSVQTLYTRVKYSLTAMRKSAMLHTLTSKEINAVSQAKAMMKILPLLTDDEQMIYKRGRNSKSNTIAKNASCIEYHIASGFESLLGYLYLSQQNERLANLLEVAYAHNKE